MIVSGSPSYEGGVAEGRGVSLCLVGRRRGSAVSDGWLGAEARA